MSLGAKDRWIERGGSLVGLVALAGVLATATFDASLAFDSWYYHLPFAARLAGVITKESYAFHPANEARFSGFALLAELLQGILWRVTGRAESANLVAFASLPLVAWFMARRWSVPFGITALSLLAIPLVQTHASSCYVDLPGNAAVTVLVLIVVDALSSNAKLRPPDVGLAIVAATVAANTKPLLEPIVALALTALFVRAIKGSRGAALAMALSLPLVFFTPLKNLVVHGNPFFPIETRLFGVTLPGPEEPYASSPGWLAAYPRPVRFIASILELGVRPLTDPHRWTVDQWAPEESGANRLGGFFGGYVALSLAMFVARAVRGRTRNERVASWTFGGFTLLVSCMPQSHELRYYLSWMMLLVCTNIGLAYRAGSDGTLRRRTLTLAALVSFFVVLLSTRGAYALPTGIDVKELVRAEVGDSLRGVTDGEQVCVKKEPFNLLWADVFHPPRRYRVVEAEAAADCRGIRELGGR